MYSFLDIGLEVPVGKEKIHLSGFTCQFQGRFFGPIWFTCLSVDNHYDWGSGIGDNNCTGLLLRFGTIESLPKLLYSANIAQ